MTPEINLHELANTPGYGIAHDRLKAAGFWKEEAAADPGKQMLYKVVVSGTYVPELETKTVEVLASSPEEAKDLAGDRTDFDRLEGAEIVSVRDLDA